MARYIGPKRRLSRREGVDLFDEATRKNSPEIAARIGQQPGQHGTSRRKKRLSGYGLQLREKQKIKRTYGVLERQFKKYYNDAAKSSDVTGEKLLQILETRLDNVVYRLGFTVTRAQARNMIGAKQFLVNGKIVDIPSYLLAEGDTIALAKDTAVVHGNFDERPIDWLNFNKSKREGKVIRIPAREDLDQEINEQLVVEFYSR